MKKVIILTLTALVLLSCGNELEFNSPAFQAKKDNVMWKAVSEQAFVDNNGMITIEASNNLDTVTLYINSSSIGEHDVTKSSSYATLEDVDGVLFSTKNTPDPSVQIYPASGVITIDDYNAELRTITGKFYFNAFNSSGLASVNFNQGIFYNVPINGSAPAQEEDNAACDNAEAEVASTQADYLSVSSGDPDFVSFCNAYKAALNVAITECGDASGDYQTEIDGLMCI